MSLIFFHPYTLSVLLLPCFFVGRAHFSMSTGKDTLPTPTSPLDCGHLEGQMSQSRAMQDLRGAEAFHRQYVATSASSEQGNNHPAYAHKLTFCEGSAC